MLKRKTALVTGSTSGIGQGIAEAFADQGANMVINGFGDVGDIENLRQSLENRSGAKALYDAADMSKPEEVRTMIANAVDAFGGVDILVNNAGIQFTSPVEEFPDETWDAIVAINMSSNFHTIKHALPKMRERGWGRIINVSSAHGLTASANKAAYVAAKHGVVGLTKVIALETAGSGVTCNAICPGWVLTPLVKQQIDDRAKRSGRTWEEEKKELLSEKMPSGEAVTPEQLGGIAVFLCSPAADQITGAPISVDGGWIAQ
jgi:3-hydroxybutyrate dehydrogenase